MRACLLFLLLGTASGAFAAAPKSYRIVATYAKDGKKIFSAATVAVPDKEAVVSEEVEGVRYFLAISAREKDAKDGKNMIFVKVRAGTLDKDQKQNVTANFGIVALENKEAEIKQQFDGPDRHTESVVVTVTRKP